MPRFDKFKASEERSYLEQAFDGPELVVATLAFSIHERNDRPGRECPCCGNKQAWCLETFEDSTILINTTTCRRKNRWEVMTEEGRAMFDRKVAEAVAWGTKDAQIWRAPTTFRCTEDAIAQICDEDTEVTLFSGGWRSGKTYRGHQKWGRIWYRRGGRNETMWLVAPFRLQAWKSMRKIFYGKDKDPPIFPVHGGKPMLALGCPSNDRVDPLAFRMLDGTRVELHHARAPGKMEGDEVLAVDFDELARVTTAEVYDICRSRIAQNRGQFMGMTVADDDGMWINEKIVEPYEAAVAEGKPTPERLVVYLSGYENVFIPKENIQRLEDGETDPYVVEQKIYGRWPKKGMFAYGDTWKPDEFVRDIEEHTPEAWGFKHDLTAQWARGLWEPQPNRPVQPPYCGALDFNWDPQTQLYARLFGNSHNVAEATLVFLREQTLVGDAEESAAAAYELDDGRYRGAALIADCHGFHDGHMYGGKPSNTKDVVHFKRLGFMLKAPIAVGESLSDPDLLESRTVARHVMREGRILLASGCTGLQHALKRAPNRRKTQKDKGTAIEKRIYNMEDCFRYLVWRCFSKHVLRGGKPKSGGSRTGLTVVPGRAAER